MRSIGTITQSHCNDCLAVKLSWTSTVRNLEGVWVDVTDERIVEPSYGMVTRAPA